jgi:uncharacterized protein YrrD
MERNINTLLNYNIGATDGVIGEVTDFYFDDQSWTIRYIIVSTGSWLSERKVLITPHAILKQQWKNGFFPINLTKKQIEDSPDIDTDKPVSRQQEEELCGHYQWQSYWGGELYDGGCLGVSMPFPVLDQKVLIEDDKKDKHTNDDIHLRSTQRVNGYHIHAADGEIGHIHDFIINDETWQILSIVVNTHNWFGGKKVLIPVGYIKKIVWTDNLVFLNITKAAVNDSITYCEADYLHLPLLK